MVVNESQRLGRVLVAEGVPSRRVRVVMRKSIGACMFEEYPLQRVGGCTRCARYDEFPPIVCERGKIFCTQPSRFAVQPTSATNE